MKIAYANVRSLNTSFSLVESACSNLRIVRNLAPRCHSELEKVMEMDCNRKKRRERGGAASLISKEVKVFERKDLLSPNIEAVWSNLYSREENFSLGSVYIQPNDTKSLNELLKVISKVLEESLPVVLTGNFNAHHQFWYDRNANKLGPYLFEFLVDKNLVVMNNAKSYQKRQNYWSDHCEHHDQW